ncbi:MAG: TIGR00153 family protein [Candidatus Thiodiazotropha sp. (ex Lucinoma aequizonata)]|nr:TIGR00153 family protein [Candidatus Thiodiazotropha sp. (ex Lucinoma aequizonata)]MCU7888565.1 TIGR00153 family protein [Candidatus Thiodiazotropha sp. (ex Lucinoma aequizonata)]MCU7896556.1 TIGR00153 family protein [Candidatus Thiodiazotropha sp. (ex Lucinoma aequizonata)]MCU7898596.1 TIGR00153 family protein [Candidatus Thiodiazotropha sp. (ex Lucinoma aequizonata)]MCU7903239.1 TIGR00153 family protein [Candidatus Thiodiazotropha sp. (ex Lucinoma aequizonata)]
MRPSNPIASLLGSSPFKPLQTHMEIIKECIAEVPGLFEALIAGNQEQLKAAKEKIFSLEHDADQIENDIRARLPKSLFMPVDRRDLLELLEMQDNIADTAQDIAGLMMERDMSVPKDMNEPLQAFVQRCVDTCNQAASIIEELDELIEMGFKGNQANKVEEMVDVLGKAEDETDDMGMALARSLFAQEESMNPVSVIFWYQMIQWIGDLANYAEKVGDRMRLLIAS